MYAFEVYFWLMTTMFIELELCARNFDVIANRTVGIYTDPQIDLGSKLFWRICKQTTFFNIELIEKLEAPKLSEHIFNAHG